jgi:hypothetical protein
MKELLIFVVMVIIHLYCIAEKCMPRVGMMDELGMEEVVIKNVNKD